MQDTVWWYTLAESLERVECNVALETVLIIYTDGVALRLVLWASRGLRLVSKEKAARTLSFYFTEQYFPLL